MFISIFCKLQTKHVMENSQIVMCVHLMVYYQMWIWFKQIPSLTIFIQKNRVKRQKSNKYLSILKKMLIFRTFRILDSFIVFSILYTNGR